MLKERLQEQVKDSKTEMGDCRLILFNDDHNTFDHVIESLMIACNHSFEQASQCALLAHLKGKSPVKDGSKERLTPMKISLQDKNLTVEII